MAADRDQLAQLERAAATVRTRIRVRELREAIVDKQGQLSRAQTQLRALQSELDSLLAEADGTQQSIAPNLNANVRSSPSLESKASNSDQDHSSYIEAVTDTGPAIASVSEADPRPISNGDANATAAQGAKGLARRRGWRCHPGYSVQHGGPSER